MNIPVLFPPNLVPLVRQGFRNEDLIPFFNAQLRQLAAETIRNQPANPVPEVPDNGPKNEGFGELMLKAGELLYQKHVVVHDELDGYANIVAEFLPSYEFTSATDPMFSFLRFYIWLTKIVPDIAATVDIDGEFQKLFPFPIITYAEFIATFAMHAIRERDLNDFTKPIDATLRKGWFKNTNVPDALIEQMFETVCFSLDKMPQSSDTLGYADFEFLKDRPYFLFNDDLYMLDYEFALGKLESAVIWRILRQLPTDRKNPWLSYWGTIFEGYVTWLFKTYADPIINLMYVTKYLHSTDEICDQVIICNDTAVLIETKLGTCSAADRHSGDYKRIRKYLEERLVTKGVSQLLNAIRRIGGKGDDVPPKLKKICKIVPVIVTRDDAGGCWGTNAYLNKRFKDQLHNKAHKGIIVTPLVSLSISNLERMMWTLKDRSLADVMEERIQTDVTLRQPFEAACTYVRRGAPPKLHAHVESYKELNDRLIADFKVTDETPLPPPVVG